jgi:hypothetical protein
MGGGGGSDDDELSRGSRKGDVRRGAAGRHGRLAAGSLVARARQVG